MVRYVYDIAEEPGEGRDEPGAGAPGRPGADAAGLLGAKGADLAGLARLGLPVPAGFTVTTEAYRVFRATGAPPPGLETELAEHLARLERVSGRRLGRVDDPLLLSVRPGARVAVPGLMPTVLDVGLNDHAVLGLAGTPARERFAWDSYRRLVRAFGTAVMGVDPALFDGVLHRVEDQHHVADESRLDACDLIRIVETYKDVVRERTGEDFPQDPFEQLRRAVRAAFASWDGEPARLHRRRAGVPDEPGTAVTVQTMVFGNRDAESGSGVALTHDPATGRPGVCGGYLPGAQGEDVASGTREALPPAEFARLAPAAYGALCGHLRRLEEHHRDVCGLDFTVERGRLWTLRSHVGEPAVRAAAGTVARPAAEGAAPGPAAGGGQG
ncbi:PEP/pyruvate-binding domain-containing protein [Streptomyces sp. DH12]|uniref:PEP/pyruvate-binding domain-containing protein n=1 Tax=Streptomyces sp. DH12 TaxID=2857010 RepID=UPI001E2DFCFA|nr:PEP/pyruvate-binding domain-containing protein [Streptomyces sp. DH12]